MFALTITPTGTREHSSAFWIHETDIFFALLLNLILILQKTNPIILPGNKNILRIMKSLAWSVPYVRVYLFRKARYNNPRAKSTILHNLLILLMLIILNSMLQIFLSGVMLVFHSLNGIFVNLSEVLLIFWIHSVLHLIPTVFVYVKIRDSVIQDSRFLDLLAVHYFIVEFFIDLYFFWWFRLIRSLHRRLSIKSTIQAAIWSRC